MPGLNSRWEQHCPVLEQTRLLARTFFFSPPALMDVIKWACEWLQDGWAWRQNCGRFQKNPLRSTWKYGGESVGHRGNYFEVCYSRLGSFLRNLGCPFLIEPYELCLTSKCVVTRKKKKSGQLQHIAYSGSGELFEGIPTEVCSSMQCITLLLEHKLES